MKIYNLVNETYYFKELMSTYFNHYIINSRLSLKYIGISTYADVYRFAIHQADSGESVYVIGYPESTNTHPTNIHFISNWTEFNISCNESDILILDLTDEQVVLTGKTIHHYNIIKIVLFTLG